MKTTFSPQNPIAAFLLLSAIIVLPSRLLAQSSLTPLSPAMTNTATNASGIRIADAPGVRDALIKLDIWLEGQRLKHDLPGFSVGVVHDQELIWSKDYGFADVANKIPATDQTLYRVASITKTFTATAIMQLVEQGKLSLEDPVSKYLPWFPSPTRRPPQRHRLRLSPIWPASKDSTAIVGANTRALSP